MIDTRLREIENDGEPVSLAESITRKDISLLNALDDSDTVNTVDVNKLQNMSLDQLRQCTASDGEPVSSDLGRREIVELILKQRIRNQGILIGHGTLQILPDGFGFLRRAESHYLSCADDIYVSPSQIRKFNLKNGAVVEGQIRPPKENERYFALLRVENVNGDRPGDSSKRTTFDDLTALHPNQRIVMEHDPCDFSTRVVDMIAPVGFGQRGLIVSPPRAGKTILMQKMAQSTLANYPEAYVIMLLIDERPEEVTDMEREVRSERCEVISSTFSETTQRHVQVSEMVLEKAKRMVETGADVVIFLDSITRLTRAWNAECPPSGKTLSGGLEANAMQKPKAFFGSARKIEEGGSLTIIATALIDTGSRMDEVIFEEFKGTGNMEIVLDRTLVERRIWPAIDINASGTRREEKLFEADQYERICLLRRALSDKNSPDAMDQLTTMLKKHKTNGEFLMRLNPSVS